MSYEKNAITDLTKRSIIIQDVDKSLKVNSKQSDYADMAEAMIKKQMKMHESMFLPRIRASS